MATTAPPQRAILSAWLAPLLAALGYGLLALRCPPQAFWSGDGGVKLLQIQGLIESRGTSLALPYPGRTVDPQQRHFPIGPPYAVKRDGAWYSTFPPFFAFATLPFYIVLGLRGLYVLPLLGGVASVVCGQRLAAHLGMSTRWQMMTGLLVAFATPLAFYSATFWEHAPATALSLAGLVLVLPAIIGNAAADSERLQRPVRADFGCYLLAGACWAAAAALRLETLSLPPAVLLATLFCSRFARPFRHIPSLPARSASDGPDRPNPPTDNSFSDRRYVWLAIALGWLAPLAVLASLNIHWFGHPLGLVSEHFQPGSGGEDTTRGAILRRMLLNDRTQGFQAALLPTFPVVAAGAIAVLIFGRASSANNMRLRFLCVLLTLWLTATLLLVPNPGGAQYAGRYLLPILPGMLVSLAAMIRHSPLMIRGAVTLLAAYSAFHGCAGAYRLWHLTNRIEGPMIDWVSQQQVDAVLVHHPFFAQQAASLFARKPMFALTNTEDDAPLLAALRKNGWRRLLLANHGPVGSPRDRHLLKLRGQVAVRPANDPAPPELRFRGYFFEIWLLGAAGADAPQ